VCSHFSNHSGQLQVVEAQERHSGPQLHIVEAQQRSGQLQIVESQQHSGHLQIVEAVPHSGQLQIVEQVEKVQAFHTVRLLRDSILNPEEEDEYSTGVILPRPTSFLDYTLDIDYTAAKVVDAVIEKCKLFQCLSVLYKEGCHQLLTTLEDLHDLLLVIQVLYSFAPPTRMHVLVIRKSGSNRYNLCGPCREHSGVVSRPSSHCKFREIWLSSFVVY